MRHIPSWFQCAALPDRWRVAGVSCGALSVWHHFALGCEGNRYLYGGEPDIGDAGQLLVFCGMDYERGKRLYASTARMALAVARVGRKLRKLPFASVDAACRDYVSTCLRTPQHVRVVASSNGAVPKPAKSPLAWVLTQFLCAGNPDKIAAAWNTPYATAVCLFDAHRDINGECDSLEDMEQERRYDEFQRAAEAAAEEGAA
jgi:hypothetical protein